MGYIGSSPLGLTLNSSPNRAVETVGKYEKKRISGDPQLYQSLFKNNGFTINSRGVNSENGSVSSTDNVLHSDDIYDTSIISILNELKKQKSTELIAADFAYLKNLGVYPNNRLMIARRFPGPIGNDLTSYRNSTPLSTLISWVPDGENFISFSFGEKWEDAEASFKNVLNDIGKGTMVSKDQSTKIGDFANSGISSIPLPGFMETLQYRVLTNMGLTDGRNSELLPGGNPNLIRTAKVRKTLGNEKEGSGLNCKFSIKMTVEYELKFINGVDPTIAYFDIISNILSFATSDSIFQFSAKFADKTKGFLSNFTSGDVKKVLLGIGEFAKALGSAILSVVEDFTKKLDEIFSPKDELDRKGLTDKIFESLKEFAKATVSGFVKKFRVRILGIINALTGSPSTPWHITIGNPKRPLFSSGDMYMESDVKLELGPILQFNDLPSSIKCEFTLTNARPLGAQEIYERFNNGEGRTYKRLNIELNESDSKVVSDIIGTQSSTTFLSNQNVFERSTPQTAEEARIARDREGFSGPIFEPYNQINSSTIISPPSTLPEEGDVEPPLIITTQYTYNATLIGNNLIRVVVNNNIFQPPIEFNWSLAEAPDTSTAILLTENIMNSSGTYNNGFQYPKSGTKKTVIR